MEVHGKGRGRGRRPGSQPSAKASQHVAGRGQWRQDLTERSAAVGEDQRSVVFTKPSKKGSIGQSINLFANYFMLEHNAKWCLYMYNVHFNANIENTTKKKNLLRRAATGVLRGGYLYDGTVLYHPQKIPNDRAVLYVTDNDKNIQITIRLVGDVAWGDGHYIQLFNIIVRKCLSLMQVKLIGRQYYMLDSKVVFDEHKIQLIFGYYTSMRQHERNILLNVDPISKCVRMDNVYDLLLECQGGRNPKKEFLSKTVNSVVMTYYNNKTYRVDDVDFDTTPQHTFKLSDGREISYIEYYQKKYRVNIRVPGQPMLISRSKRREIRAGMPETVYLVPELCQMTGLTDRQRQNFNLMRTLSSYTRVGVPRLREKLMEFSEQLSSRPEALEEIRRWDLQISESLIKFQGRVLPTEQIVSGKNDIYLAGRQADWTKEMRNRPMFFAPKMDRLAVVCPSYLKKQTQDFLQILKTVAEGMHWSLGSPKLFEIANDQSSTYITNIDRIIDLACPTLILTIVKNNSLERYSAIKKKCYVDRGVSSQVLLAKNLTPRGVQSIATKVAIQLSCKIGGAPWSVSVPLSGLMVVGYDVGRDTVRKKKSFSGMVASLDRQMTRYFSCVSEHEMEEELCDNFAAKMILACKKYRDERDRYPEWIIIYRDGVGQGQLPYVATHEVENIKRKLMDEIYGNSGLKMGFIVVAKRTNTKIFTEKENPPPGTVVDDVITIPDRYDFYLISQCVNQGTVVPTYYTVLFNTTGLPAEKLQILTYKLTHLYYNWSGTVKVPAPCQYAHKLAFMVTQNLHRPPHPDLENVLFYL